MNWDLNELHDLDDKEKELNKKTEEIGILINNINELEYPLIIKDIFERSEYIFTILSSIYAKGILLESQNINDSNAQLIKSRTKNLILTLEDTLRPFWFFIKGLIDINGFKLDDVRSKELFSSIPKLEYYLNRTRILGKYSLDKNIEEVISRKDMIAISALNDLRAQIELSQRYEVKVNEKTKPVDNLSELSRYFYNKNKDTRRSAYTSLYSQVEKNLSSYFTIYQAIVKDHRYEALKRGYSSSISVRNIDNDISDNIIESLIGVVSDNRKIFQDLFKLKSEYLRLDELTRSDIYTAIDHEESDISFLKAKELVLELFNNFDKDFYIKANELFKNEHIDALPKTNKTNGAYCLSLSPLTIPYVMLNFTGTRRDVLVMAHELGHAVHYMYSSNQSYFTYDAPLILAETASTFCELLVFDELLKRTKDKDKKISLLFEKLTDIYATIARQIYFIKFEILAHEKLEKGISKEELSNEYYELIKELFGPDIKIDKIFSMEWANIPHIFRSPFYCYAYAFGNLLAISLYEKYKQDGNDFKEKIKNILSAGSIENPEELLLKNGIDISKKGFWQEGFTYINELKDELMMLIEHD